MTTRVVDVNLALCRALGLNPEYVSRITIEISPDDLPRVTTIYKMRDSVADQFTTEVNPERYHLVPIEEGCAESNGETA